MNDSSQHELLSAYLDGELTADEQVQVERLLADDPRAKRLLDELRVECHAPIPAATEAGREHHRASAPHGRTAEA